MFTVKIFRTWTETKLKYTIKVTIPIKNRQFFIALPEAEKPT